MKNEKKISLNNDRVPWLEDIEIKKIHTPKPPNYPPHIPPPPPPPSKPEGDKKPVENK